MGGEYQGSQAYAHLPGGKESVNHNTGTVHFSYPLIKLRGVVGSVDLHVALTYSDGLSGSFGLPRNWTFSIPHVIPGKSVTTQGKTYAIDPDWYDKSGYRSGLRYVNNHGMKFEQVTGGAIPLPSGNPGSYSYRFRMTDGAVDYYDATGKLVEHADLFGNVVQYSYVNLQADPTSALLAAVGDVRNKIKFQYTSGSITVIGPDGSQNKIFISSQGVERVVDAMGYVTSFTYTDVSSRRLLTIIKYPSTLRARFEYQSMLYYDQNGQQQSLPAVKDHYHLDGNGAVLSRTNYRFGDPHATGGGTYTGWSAKYRFGGQTDTLIESNNQAYRFVNVLCRSRYLLS
jgi:hypothetical protein